MTRAIPEKQQRLVDSLRSGWTLERRSRLVLPGEMKKVSFASEHAICRPPDGGSGEPFPFSLSAIRALVRRGVLKEISVDVGRRAWRLTSTWGEQ